VFTGIKVLRNVELWDKPLQESVVCFHNRFDLATDYDPLLQYGVVDGCISLRDLEESSVIHNIILHWMTPHLQLVWTDLHSAIGTFSQEGFSHTDLDTYNNQGAQLFYMFCMEHLVEIGHIVLAIHQILCALAEFFYHGKRGRFKLNLEFHFLKTAAWHTSQPEILLVLWILQHQSFMAAKHITLNLSLFACMFNTGMDVESVSLWGLTCPSIRSQFGVQSPWVELAKMITQPGYAVSENNPLYATHQQLVNGLTVIPQDVYCHKG
jgi:hypothetical protein